MVAIKCFRGGQIIMFIKDTFYMGFFVKQFQRILRIA